MVQHRKLMIITFLAVMMIPMSTIANAYVLAGWKWSSNTIYYYYDDYNTARGKSFFLKGASAWNTANVDAKFVNKTANGIFMSEAYYPDVDWDGLTQTSYYPSTGYVATQSISVNTAMSDTWNSDGALQSVVVHELGHGFGIGDLYNDEAAIMNGYTWGPNSRFEGYKLTTPTSDDKNGVNSIY